MAYTVFVSHGWHDRWLAQRMAELVVTAGADAFIDIFHIESGDRIESKVHDGLTNCTELISLLTPWSVDRNWVWSEMAGAWILKKRYVGVMYGLTLDKIDRDHGGTAILSPTNVISLNEFDKYIHELKRRIAVGAGGST